MKEQYIKIHRWMTELGLNARELIVYAFVSAYTGFKGYFDGTAEWLAKWIGTTPQEAEETLKTLNERGYIITSMLQGGTRIFKRCAISAPKSNINNNNYSIDINNNIGHIGPIEEKINDLPIGPIEKDPIGPIGNIGHIESIEKDAIEPIGNIDMENGSGDTRESETARILNDPRIQALKERFGSLGSIPTEMLCAAVAEISPPKRREPFKAI